jgi:hypothetical protein
MQSTSVAGGNSVPDHRIPPPGGPSFDRAVHVLRFDAIGLNLHQRLEGRAGTPVAGPALSQVNHHSGQTGLFRSGQLPEVPDNLPMGDADPWAKQKRSRNTNVSNTHDLPSAADGDVGARRQPHEDRPLKLATGVWPA